MLDTVDNDEIIAIDFDGVLTIGDNFPEIGEPNLPMIQWAIDRKSEGAKLILWTCREGENLTKAVSFCSDYGLKFDAVNKNLDKTIQKYGLNSRKVHATVYIDDKAINSIDLMKNIGTRL